MRIFLLAILVFPSIARADDALVRRALSGAPIEHHELRMEARRIQLCAPIEFKKDRKRVRHAFRPALDDVADFLNRHPEIRLVRVIGHADPSGPAAWNVRLSEMRAQAVVDYLVKQGIARERLDPEGVGADRPWSERTVVFQVIELATE